MWAIWSTGLLLAFESIQQINNFVIVKTILGEGSDYGKGLFMYVIYEILSFRIINNGFYLTLSHSKDGDGQQWFKKSRYWERKIK